MKRALILGCSHAAGSEIECDDHFQLDQFQRYNSFASIIARSVGYHPCNMAIPAGSNEAMFRLFYEHGKDFDLIVAAWTGSERTEIYADGSGWLPMSHGVVIGYPEYDNYGKHWVSYETGATPGHLRKIRCVLGLNSMAQHWRIPVINTNAFQAITDFDWPKNILWLPQQDFCIWCLSQGFESTAMGHFLLDAHQSYAASQLPDVKKYFADISKTAE